MFCPVLYDVFFFFGFPFVPSVISIFANLCIVKITFWELWLGFKSKWVGLRAERLQSALQSFLWDREGTQAPELPCSVFHDFAHIYYSRSHPLCPESSQSELVSRFPLVFHTFVTLLMLFYLIKILAIPKVHQDPAQTLHVLSLAKANLLILSSDATWFSTHIVPLSHCALC